MAEYLNVFENTEIYIISPTMVCGGADALHQLVYYLNQEGFHATVVYPYANADCTVKENYHQYTRSWITMNDIRDMKENILIFPEDNTYLQYYKNFHNIQKAVWFLGLRFYRGFCGDYYTFVQKCWWIIKMCMIGVNSCFGGYRIRLKKNVNLTASHYAFDYIKKKGGNPRLFIEPVSLEIIHYMQQRNFQFDSADKRENIILYNPKRDANNTVAESLQKKFSQYQFLPLQGYTHDQMLTLMNKSKLLIEFGNFPGAERIPKEAVICGMCIIANNEGSARFKEDVVIDDQYKFDGYDNHQNEIQNLIVDIMEHYENHVHHFDDYRSTIYQLEENFIQSIREIFRKAE